jgi:hypothetical protein
MYCAVTMADTMCWRYSSTLRVQGGSGIPSVSASCRAALAVAPARLVRCLQACFHLSPRTGHNKGAGAVPDKKKQIIPGSTHAFACSTIGRNDGSNMHSAIAT